MRLGLITRRLGVAKSWQIKPNPVEQYKLLISVTGFGAERSTVHLKRFSVKGLGSLLRSTNRKRQSSPGCSSQLSRWQLNRAVNHLEINYGGRVAACQPYLATSVEYRTL